MRGNPIHPREAPKPVLLAFDTSTDTMSIAVERTVEGAPRVWQHRGAGGAQASANLLPVILDLMAQAGLDFADLDAVVFGRGPGAFTGLRTACSVAQGLAFGAQPARAGRPLPVLPVDTLLAVAEEARFQHATTDTSALRVLALLDARMDQVYAAGYAFDGVGWTQYQETRLDQPENLVLTAGCMLAGNVFGVYGARLPPATGLDRVAALPTATALLRLAPALLAAGHAVSAEQALPLYIRDKVAQTSSERAAAKLAMSRPDAPKVHDTAVRSTKVVQ